VFVDYSKSCLWIFTKFWEAIRPGNSRLDFVVAVVRHCLWLLFSRTEGSPSYVGRWNLRWPLNDLGGLGAVETFELYFVFLDEMCRSGCARDRASHFRTDATLSRDYILLEACLDLSKTWKLFPCNWWQSLKEILALVEPINMSSHSSKHHAERPQTSSELFAAMTP